MFVTTGCSSRRQFVATASRHDTNSRQQNTDSGRQVTASGQFYKPSQAQESKYGNYALLLLCRLKWKTGSTVNERNFIICCYLSLLNTSLKVVSKIVENQFLSPVLNFHWLFLIQDAQKYFGNILDQNIRKELE